MDQIDIATCYKYISSLDFITEGFPDQQLMQNYWDFISSEKIIHKNIRFPTYFDPHQLLGNEYRIIFIKGISAAKDFKQNEAIIAVPVDSCIHVFKAFQNEKCMKIIKENESFFNFNLNLENQQQSDFLILQLFVIIEKLNPLSKWRSILKFTNESTCLIDCKEELLKNDNYLFKQLQEFKEQYVSQKQQFIKLIQPYFECSIEKEYDWSYRYVMTRRLSIAQNFPCTFLVPLVDMINHGQDRVRFSLINLKLEKDLPEFYECSHAKLFELFGINENIQEEKKQRFQKVFIFREQEYIDYEIAASLLTNRGRINYILMKQELLYEEEINEISQIANSVKENDKWEKILLKYIIKINLRILYMDEERQLWHLHCFDDRDDEDDLEYSELYSKKQQPQSIEKEVKCVQIEKNNVEAAVDDDYIKQFYNLEDEEGINIPVQEEKQTKSFEVPKSYQWFTEFEQSGKNFDSFIIVQASQDIEQNKQLLNLYGRSGNDQLLLYYGFVLPKNKYDRLPFRIHMKARNENDLVMNIKQMIFTNYVTKEQHSLRIIESYEKKKPVLLEFNEFTKEFRLSKNKINLQLLNFLRTYFIALQTNSYEAEKVSLPNSFEQELIVINLYIQILDYLHTQLIQNLNPATFMYYIYSINIKRNLSQKTQLNDQESWEEKLAIYRYGKFKIVRSQQNLMQRVQTFLITLLGEEQDLAVHFKNATLEALQSCENQEKELKILMKSRSYFKNLYECMGLTN